jgi:hypothetical protein
MEDDHNGDEDWYYEKKCPMYLNEIYDYDNSWPEEDDEVQALMIKKRTIKMLRDFLNKHGEEKY